MGSLEKIQSCVYDRLSAVFELRYAAVDVESDSIDAVAASPEGLHVRVCSPIPLKASKYAAGPTFSEVEIRIRIKRDARIATRAPSLSSVSEAVSRELHNWVAPSESGYGRFSLSENSPWEFKGDGCVEIKFKVQSVLS